MEVQEPAPVDADDHLGRVLGVIGDERVHLPEPAHPTGNRPRPSTALPSSITSTSLWASAQSTPTKITATSPRIDHAPSRGVRGD